MQCKVLQNDWKNQNQNFKNCNEIDVQFTKKFWPYIIPLAHRNLSCLTWCQKEKIYNTTSVCFLIIIESIPAYFGHIKSKGKKKLVQRKTIAICVCVLVRTTQKHVHTECVCVFMKALSDFSLWSGAQRPTVAQPGTVLLSPLSCCWLHDVPLLQGGQHIYIKVQPLYACDHQHCLSFDQLWLMLC